MYFFIALNLPKFTFEIIDDAFNLKIPVGGRLKISRIVLKDLKQSPGSRFFLSLSWNDENHKSEQIY